MSSRRRGEDEDGESFSDAVGDVKPRADRAKFVPPSAPRPSRPGIAVAETTPFDFPIPGEPRVGVAQGISRRQLQRLRDAEIRPEMTLDLHGRDSASARGELRKALERAWESGRRCVLVVHGRGRHSAGDPVLRDALLGWLAEPPLAGRVLAFTPAHHSDGGEGASYVLLRRH
ncbi:MAG: Smr/MutS family protein [Myxococcota bacterium]